jgi:hypothetical protein
VSSWAAAPAVPAAPHTAASAAAAPRLATDPATQLYGYRGPSGAWLLEPVYSQAWDFDAGLAFVEYKDNGGVALINAAGEIVVPNVERAIWYMGNRTAFPRFSEGLLAARDIETNKVGFVDGAGQWVIKPRFSDAYEFHEGLAAIRPVPDGRIGFIDRRGAVVIAPRFATNFWAPPVFSEGLAAVGLDEAWPHTNLDPPGHLGYIDRKGRWLIPPKYSAGESFKNGRATVRLGERKIELRHPLKR